MDALDLLARYAGADGDRRFYAAGEKVPVDGVVPEGVAGRRRRRATAGSSGSRTSCACWSRCGRRCAAGRSTSQGAGALARPRRRPARRLRRQPRRPLRRAGQAAGRRPSSSPACASGWPTALTRLDAALADGTSRRGADHHPARAAVDQRAEARRRCPSRRTWARSRPRSTRRWGTLDLLDMLKDTDVPHRLHRPSSPRSPPARCSTATPCAGGCCCACSRSARTWASGDRRHRRARRDRGRAAARPPPLHHPRQPARARSPSWSTPPSRPGTRTGGARAPRARRTRRSSAPGSRT